MRKGVLSGVTDKWRENDRKPVSWLMFVGSLGAGAAAAILEIQLCKIVQFCFARMENFSNVDELLDTEVVTR